ncbi:2-polyprenyl-6-methoxyphenol hydroxylase-like FAD-dependent oxidoreductase [Chryseobacterium ginsenosidimutans]|uniref:FAD-dependent oxidoreductase n=1 Tax=Chryseobacterium ginsenosidimutans TaxID=687846 RepID=UPI0021671DB2|nr:NAD(P)/FAD-dependent oxidoreductase [Chryseobacterium ginsenosidimutans]MCS3868619.1 2-polyprenyl-6-methoxyphenol hydroxylase-like FAD-dependent oxidoreductase [Chryseobacterium ginsenosidimutans]
MVIQNKKIAIVGGGPGGLTLARLLQLKNAEVKVYERDENKDVRVQGATLDLHEESGLEALRRAGLMDEFKANFRPNAGKLKVLDKNLNIYLDEHSSGDSHSEDRPEIDRTPLRKILLESLQPETVVWDSQFVSMEKQNEGWLLHFKNGNSYYADLVIAADGANSKIRSYLTDIKPIYSGITMVEGNIYHAQSNTPKLWELVNVGKIFTLDEEKSLLFSTKEDGTLTFYTGCKTDENWVQNSGIDFKNKNQVFDWFKKEFGSWDKNWQELFESDEISIIPRPQYHYPLDQNWETLSNLTLLGDAAHRMPPYAGEGVNMAMQDAFELAESLTRSECKDVKSAILNYEQKMLKRASEITKITLENTEMLHSENAIEVLLRMFQGE